MPTEPTGGGDIGGPRLDQLARRWAGHLSEWAIPDEILAAAPESPWGFPPALFATRAEGAQANDATPSRRRALEALTEDGTVLDVGAGAGAASLALAPPATAIVAVDESPAMLEQFDRLAEARSISHRAITGRWPDVAEHVPSADVVVCHHVLYNVPDVVPFLEALTAHARRRVVIEATETHPQSELNDLWRHFHGLTRPKRPVAADLVAILRAMGNDAAAETFNRPSPWLGNDRAVQVAFARKRLCLGAERDAEIDARLVTADRRLVCVWYDAPRPRGSGASVGR